jgi:AraC-like DNA-binding protein
MTDTNTPLQILAPPYRGFSRLSGSRRQLKMIGKEPGSALVWSPPTRKVASEHLTLIRNRPGGLALVVVLPPPSELPDAKALIEATEISRPAAVLPHQPSLSPGLICEVLRQPSEELGADVVEYMRWRGLRLDRETAHLVRRTVELSDELRTVSALARSLYLSRRALGRRFLVRGLPVPSHWLHFARLLRVLLRLQASDASVLSVGFELGYPDGFALSNQMVRLTGVRPSQARVCLGWEWFMEAWLRTEAELGGLRPPGSAGSHAESAGEHGRRPAKEKSGLPDATS